MSPRTPGAEEGNRFGDYPADSCVHELFAAQVQRTPEAVALTCGDVSLGYRELNESANRLAHHLVSLGVGADTLVGICLSRGIDMVVGLLAILKAGGAYVPLDPDYPPERLAFMLEDSGAELVVTHSELRAHMPDEAALVPVDADRDAIAAHPATDPKPTTTPGNLAYVIYTSGSTGTPKGVMVTHSNVTRLFAATADDFAFDSSDVWTLFHSYAFDFSVWELWGALLHGGRLVVVPKMAARSPEALLELVRAHGVTVLNQTPSAFRQLLHAEAASPHDELPLRFVVFGGEALEPSSLRPWIERHGVDAPRLVNMYGITETTVHVTRRVLEEADAASARSPIGHPISDLQTYILDRYGNPVPKGVPGELYVGGAGLARGYLNRAGLTAERFVPDPFAQTSGARLYRTGDRARYLEDGNIEFLGRVDDQVKIRGFRIEPGEIEVALTRQEAVRDAVVVARSDDGTDKRLVAYVTTLGSSNPPRPPELRAQLLESLPDHMVPAAFVVLDELPLTPNGKLDRAALPAPEGRPELDSAYVAPRTRTEEILAGIWAGILGVERVGVQDDFFELGGHSLMATEMGSRARRALGVPLSSTEVLGKPTIALLAREIESLRNRDRRPPLPAVEPSGRETTAPLSLQQETCWYHSKLAPKSIAYQAQTTIRVVGRFDMAVFERAVTEIATRHEIIRTTYREVDGRGEQIVHPRPPEMVTQVDLSTLPSDERAARLDDVVHDELRKPFDLTRLPLMRWTVVRLGPEEHEIILVEHHLVHDGFSFTLLMRELSALYTAFANGEESPLEDLPIQYRDYARWQRKALELEGMQTQREAWSRRLAGVSRALELPGAENRPAVQRFWGNTMRIDLSPGLPNAVREFCAAERVTPFMAMFAAFTVLLHRYSGESDVTIASGFANRNVDNTDRLIGMFVNPVLLRCDLAGDPSYRAVLHQARDVVLEAMRNQELPFPEVVRMLNPPRDTARVPLLDVMFSFHDAPLSKLDFAGATGTVFERANGSAKTDLNVIVIPGAESRRGDDDRISLLWEYNTDLFGESFIVAMASHLDNVLRTAITEPNQSLSQMEMLRAPELHHLVVELNDTAADYPAEACVHELFSAQAQRTPDALALVSGEQEVTYQELNASANCLAHHLGSLGVGPGTLVGVCIPRGLDMIVGLLAILKAGGAYVPLDPGYPQERLTFMLEDTGAEVVVTHSELRDRIAASGVTPVLVDEDRDTIAARPAGDPEATTRPDDLAYVIYTSGSTGTPKGVAVPHRAINRLVCDTDYVRLTPEHRVAQASNSSFDAMTFEVWGALLSGAALVVVDEDVLLSPQRLGDFLRASGVTTLFVTTALFNQIVTQDPSAFASLEHLLFGGEACDPDRVRQFLDATSSTGLRHVYGPTETTTFASWCRVDDGVVGRTVPIGRPIANTQIYILDRYGYPVSTGVAGELYIGGPGLARGYLNRASLTAERFVPDPFSKVPGARLYRTGDRGRYLTDGNVEFLGRVDDQVKIRGFRIEPGEIEAILTRHPSLTDAVVLARADEGSGKRLVAYFTALDSSNPPGPPELRAYLSGSLPDYMIPAAFVALDELPLTPNGKLDRAALPAPEGRPELEHAYVAPRTPTEEIVAGIWQEVLGLERVGVRDDFFELGGHSLVGIQVMSRLWSRLGVEIAVGTLFGASTVEALAEIVDEIILEEIEALSEADAADALYARLMSRSTLEARLERTPGLKTSVERIDRKKSSP